MIDRDHTIPAGIAVQGLGPGVTVLQVVPSATLTVSGDLLDVSLEQWTC